MLYETLKQSIIVIATIYFGVLGGVLYELKVLSAKPFKNKIINILFDAIFCVLLALLFLFSVNFTNYGEIRLYILASFFLGFAIERISIGTMLAKVFNFLYNIFSRLIKKIKLPKILSKKREKFNEGVNAKTIS
ncbi:MAG: spore cortex biosynthesis protein YabQ [Clostridia bacterium]|nr:spore cortex biosynthesis protein YabQ [Clostridia bacterium]